MKMNPIKRKRVMVTGSAGVIRRELLRMLIEKEVRILSIDRNPLPEWDWALALQEVSKKYYP